MKIEFFRKIFFEQKYPDPGLIKLFKTLPIPCNTGLRIFRSVRSILNNYPISKFFQLGLGKT